MKSGLPTLLLFVGAILAGALAVFFANKYITSQVDAKRAELERQYEKVVVVVPKQDLRPGTRLSTALVASRPVPKAFVHADAIRSENFELINNTTLIFPVNKGEPILSTHISNRSGSSLSKLIDDGKRALTFPVDIEASMTGMLKPNDRIDLIMTISDGSAKKTMPLLSNVDVLATGERVDELSQVSDVGRFQTITLLVASEEAAKIIHAQDVSDLSVLLRSPTDKANAFNKAVTKDTLLGKVKRKAVRRSRGIEVIKGAE